MEHRAEQLQDYDGNPMDWWVCASLDCIFHILHLGPTTRKKLDSSVCPARMRDPLGRVYPDQGKAIRRVHKRFSHDVFR